MYLFCSILWFLVKRHFPGPSPPVLAVVLPVVLGRAFVPSVPIPILLPVLAIPVPLSLTFARMVSRRTVVRVGLFVAVMAVPRATSFTIIVAISVSVFAVPFFLGAFLGALLTFALRFAVRRHLFAFSARG